MATMKYKDSSGNWVDIPTGNTKSELIDIIYPVGSIYMSVNTTSPETLFGGTWEQIQDTFLLSSGSTYTSGTTGGSSTHTPSGTVGSHTLTVAELPSHNHGLNSHTHTYAKANSTTGSHTLTVSEMPSHSHTFGSSASGTSTSKTYSPMIDAGVSGNYWGVHFATTTGYFSINGYMNNTGGGGGHTHSISTTSTNSGAASGNTANTGSGSGHSHSFTGDSQDTMPPYLVVNVWKRTA